MIRRPVTKTDAMITYVTATATYLWNTAQVGHPGGRIAVPVAGLDRAGM